MNELCRYSVSSFIFSTDKKGHTNTLFFSTDDMTNIEPLINELVGKYLEENNLKYCRVSTKVLFVDKVKVRRYLIAGSEITPHVKET